MTVKSAPHHDLAAIQSKFVDQAGLEMTTSAARSANALGYSLGDVVAVVQSLEQQDFVKSETAHSPRNSRVWHDTYKAPMDGLWLYLKFAGETLIDVTLVSFKEV
ncbi:MAG: type II toxin-antitoxin system MqsR family toxin [Sphingomicrobium sp.]